MGAEPQKLHVAFFPLMAAGHMIPILDIAKLFTSHNVKATIITTPLNAPFFTKPQNIGPKIDIEIIPFPSSNDTGLPEGMENMDQFSTIEMTMKFMKAIEMFQEPLEEVLAKLNPNCLVADMFFPIVNEVAAKFNIPRLVFHGTSCFAICATRALTKYEPHKSVSSDDEEFVLPNLPHEIKMMRSKLPEYQKESELEMMLEWFRRALEAEEKSFGVIVNSFYELEPDYGDYYRKVMGRRTWHIGPVSLCNREIEAKFQRGKDSSINEHECLRWLDSKRPNSVIYICFGSLSIVSNSQLLEIAKGLEATGRDFIWVVRGSKDEEEKQEWLPTGFEKRMEGKGLIVRGWAPQMLILDHEAIGLFVTHCGWNSTLEGISCGVPMVTWPVFAEQFHNEKFVTEILKTGVPVGAKRWSRTVEDSVNSEDIRHAIERVMVGEEGLEIRSRAMKLKDLARKAIEEGGSSYSDLSSLIRELGSYHRGGV